MTTAPMDVARLADMVEELQRRIAKLEKQVAEAQGQHGPVQSGLLKMSPA